MRRPPVEATGGIEWDDEPAAAPGDVAEPEPPAPVAPPRRGRRLSYAVLAVAGAVAALVYARQAHDAEPSASPASVPVHTRAVSATPVPAPSGFVVHLGDRNGTLRNDVEVVLPQLSDPPACSTVRDGLSSCTVETSVPPAFVAAVRARFAPARLGGARTEVLESRDRRGTRGLWSRRVIATVGPRTVRIVVSTIASTYPMAANSFDDGNRVIDFAQHRLGRYTVEVQATAPSGTADALDAVEALARDRRLLARP